MELHELIYNIEHLIFENNKSKTDLIRIKNLTDQINSPLKQLMLLEVFNKDTYVEFNQFRKKLETKIKEFNDLKKETRTQIEKTNIDFSSNKELLNNFIGLYAKNEIRDNKLCNDFIKILEEIKKQIKNSDIKLNSVIKKLKNLKYIKDEELNIYFQKLEFILLSKGWNKKDIQSEISILKRDKEKNLDRFLNNIQKTREEFLFLIPLQNFKCDKETPIIFNDRITLFEKYESKEIENSEGYPKDISKFMKSRLIEVKIDAFGWEEARTNLFKLMSAFIDLLSLFLRSESELAFGLGSNTQYNYLTYSLKIKKYVINKYPKHLELVHLDISSKIIDDFKKVDFIFNKNTKELHTSFKNASHFFRKGNLTTNEIDKFIFYIIALESLLIKKEDWQERISPIMEDILIQRTIKVMGIIKDYEVKYIDLIKKLYYTRHQIIHYGDTSLVSPEKLKDLKRIVGDVLYQFLYATIDLKLDKLSEFLEYIDKKVQEMKNNRETEITTDKLCTNEDYLCKGVLLKSGEFFADVKFILTFRDDGRYILNIGKLIEIKTKGSYTLNFGETFTINGKIISNEREFIAENVNIFSPLLMPFVNLKQFTEKGLAPEFNIGKVTFK